MPAWPATLPAPRVAGYGLNPVDMTARTEMEVGPVRVRRRSSASVIMVPVQWNLSDAQMALFRTWYHGADGADGGAGWFSVSLLMGNGGFQTVQARFSGIWQAGYVPHMRWQVQATLEVREYAYELWNYHRLLEMPSLDLDFINDSYSYWDGSVTQNIINPFSGLITFTRGSTADYYDASGDLQTAAINQPCIDHAPITGARLGLRIRKADGARAQDRAVITGASLMKWAREDEGTLIADVVTNVAATGQNQFFIHASNGTTSMRTALYQFSTGTSAYVTVTNTGVNSVAMSAGQYTVGQKFALGLAYKANDFFATANGGPGAADLSGPVAAMPTRLDIGSRADGATFVNDAHIRRIRFFPYRVSNGKLMELTA